MYKRLLFAVVAILATVAVLQAKTIEKTFFYSDFQLQQKGEYTTIIAPGALNTAPVGQPMLPWYATKILLPPGEEIKSVEFEASDIQNIYGHFQLLPMQYSQPLSKGPGGSFVKDEAVYQSNTNYPAENTNQGYTGFWSGHSIGMVNFTPFIYRPKTGELSYYRQFTIIIHTRPTARARQALSLISPQKQIEKEIKSFVDNPAAMDAYPVVSDKSDNNYEMLIITPAQFEADFDTLIKHYLIRGIRAQVKTREDIESEMSGQDTQEKIRNYIIQEYSNHGIMYVMLGGDVEHIPYRGFYCMVQSSSVYEDSNIPSDLYYSALDGSWNDDGDSKWGEIGEDDLLPEVGVARFSFSNSTELASMLHKTITYQTTPVTGNLGHPLMAGEHLYDSPQTWGSDYLELLIGYHDDNGYETTGIPEDNTFTKLYDKNSSWSASQLIAEINSGKNFLHHVGHANSDYVMKLSISDITNGNFSGANGTDHQYTNVYTHGCICGAFDNNDCIAEYMVKIDNFAASFVGNSRYGWFNEGQTEGPSAHIHREFVNALYTDSLDRIGMTHMKSKYATAPWVNASGQWEEGALRWCFYDCNVLGDPAMSIWTAEPWDIDVTYPSAVAIGQTECSINISSSGNPVEGLTAAIVMDNTLYGAALSNENGDCQITFDPVFTAPGLAKLYVSGFNCIPHEYDIQIIPAEGAYIILNACEVNDAAGNNNQMLDYSETANLNITLENVGSALAESVSAHLSCNNPNITITNADASFGDMEGNSILSLDDAFGLQVSDNIENGTVCLFTLNINCNKEQWEATFSLTALAPELSFLSFEINDESGNNNNRLDPGETVQFIVNFSNAGGSTSPEVMANLSSTSSFINITNPNQTNAALNPAEETSLSFEVSVDEDAETGDIADFNLNLAAGNYQAFMNYLLPVGMQVEDWETGDFSQYDWNFDNTPWFITTAAPYEGSYCAQSGDITDGQSSKMHIGLSVVNTDSISFFYKVSSEASYDYLKFYIDENEINKWSGEQGWTRVAFLVNQGEHNFTWSYEKDGSISNGQDAACIDYIVFPAAGIYSGINEQHALVQLSLYPNPSSEKAYLSFTNKEAQNLSIQMVDQYGKTVLHIPEKAYSKGAQKVFLNLDGISAGSYTVLLKTAHSFSTLMFIKL